MALNHEPSTSSLPGSPGRQQEAVRAYASLGALAVFGVTVAACGLGSNASGDEARSSATYRPEVVARVGVVAAGRHFAADAGMRMLARGGNAVDAGVGAVFAAAVSEISHFGLGGEVPIILYLADRREVIVISGQGVAPAAEEQRHRGEGRRAAIYAARDRFYKGDIGQRIVRAVQDAGGLLTAEDLTRYRGRVEKPTRLTFRASHGTFEVFKTGFWGQGP